MAGAVAGGGGEGALLAASLQVLFDRMASRDFLTFLGEQKLGVALLRELKIKLLTVQVVLNDAEAKQITNSAVKDWMDELKDAVYNAEDCSMISPLKLYAARWSTLILKLRYETSSLLRESSPG